MTLKDQIKRLKKRQLNSLNETIGIGFGDDKIVEIPKTRVLTSFRLCGVAFAVGHLADSRAERFRVLATRRLVETRARHSTLVRVRVDVA